MARPPSERVTAACATECGKTEFLRRHFLTGQRAARLLVVDRTGEWFEKEPHAPSAVGLQPTIRLLDEYAHKSRWRIITSLSNEEVEQLGGALVGIPDTRDGYAFNVGGMGLYLPEVELLVPMTGASEALRSLWRRGSHAGLSIYADAQRVSNLSKEVTSQCRWMVFLHLDEPADIKYLYDSLGSRMAPPVVKWIQGTRYAAALFDKRRRVVHLIDPHGSCKQTITGLAPDEKQSDSDDDP